MFSTYVPSGSVERSVVKAWNEYVSTLEEGEVLHIGEAAAKIITAALASQREVDIKDALHKS